jgi:hypothetical protein
MTCRLIRCSHLLLDAELGDGADLGRALGAEDLATSTTVVLSSHHAKLEIFIKCH